MKRQGFTLIELMIVITVIAFLAMIAVPSFMQILAKAKRSEAYMNLRSLYAAQKMHWLEHGTYANKLSGSGGLGWMPEGYQGGGANEHFCYTYGFGHGAEGQHYFTGKLGAPCSHLHQAYAGKDSFMIVAAGDIDNDGDPDIIGIDHNNNIVILSDDLK